MPQIIEPIGSRTRHAVILAAGESKRTRPLTLHRPKPLIPLLGRPLLAHILDELVGLVNRVTLVVGYRADAIRLYFGSIYRGIELLYVDQTEINGTASAVQSVANVVHEPFFLLYGDNLISRQDLLQIASQRYCMAALQVEDPRSFGVLDIVNGYVTQIIEKPTHPPPGAPANPGIYHFDQGVFSVLAEIRPSPRGEYELTDVIALLAQKYDVGYAICAGHWIPVGTPWEALNAMTFLLAYQAQLHASTIVRTQGIEGSAWLGRVQLGEGSRIIGPTHIGDGVVIGANCVIKQSAIEQGVTIGDGCIIEHSAIGAGVTIGNNTVVQSSFLDDAVYLSANVHLPERLFTEIQIVAVTRGILDRAELCRRGAVLGAGVRLPEGSALDPGSIIME